MPETFTLAAVNYKGEKPNPRGGVLHKHYCTLRDETGVLRDEVYWQSVTQHHEGEEVYGDIEDGEYGPRFRTVQKPDGSGNQGSSGGTFSASRYQKEGMTKDDYWTAKNERDVESQARMGRAHAQEMAVRWFAYCGRPEDRAIDIGDLLPAIDWFHQDVQRFPIDADLGGGNGTDAPLAPAADVSADRSTTASITTENRVLPVPPDLNAEYQESLPPEEASPAQKGKLTQMFTKAGLSRDAMKAVVLYRCRSEKATKDGASKLIQDLMDGATHDTLLAEIHDAGRAGDPLAIRAAKLIPSDTPLAPEPVEVVPPNGEKDIPF